MATDIKHTQLTRVAYTYQDYVCVEKLLEWYRDPERYQWVSVEGAQTDDGGPKSLDDVVALDKDGSYELYQVKFTTDAKNEVNEISFEWLLKHKPKGTSLIQKWASDVEKYSGLGNLSISALKTNRTPNAEFKSCLEGNKVNPKLIPHEQLTEIENQLGSTKLIELFFSKFTFDHSLQKIDDFEQELESLVVPDHTSSEGWLRFLKTVQVWATRKNQPAPDGKILFSHLREIIASNTTSTLSQFFEVPDGYAPPSQAFHIKTERRTKSVGCWVISGLPGMGKSTYLSYLTDQLIKKRHPVIRHHYSLVAQGVTDRISFPNAACSLLRQLQEVVPELRLTGKLKHEELEKWILEAAQLLSKDEKSKRHNSEGFLASLALRLNENKFTKQLKARFPKLFKRSAVLTVIIDGLDHVARERQDIAQLEHMINRLLPLTDKICLILGTQPVGDKQLPSKLVTQAPRKTHWFDLPRMDLNSIKSWLETQIANDELHIHGDKHYQHQQISEISEALLKISEGYPLHLIYSVKNLQSQNAPITKYEIEKLPKCIDGNIHNYYEGLWSNLSASARQILTLIACVEFPWPNMESIKHCTEGSLEFYNYFDEIRHLVEVRRSGIVPFHGSILIFIRQQDTFEQSKGALLDKTKEWLENSAPDFWKWSWTWIVHARLGDSHFLLDGITHEWSVDALCKGYPVDHIEHIISIAEEIAFEERKFARLTSIRQIRYRLVNGPEFQLQEYDEFLTCALKLNPESYGLLWRADNLLLINDSEIAVVAALSKDIDPSISGNCFNEIFRRLIFYAQLDDHSYGDKLGSLISAAISILVTSENPSVEKIFSFIDQLSEKKRHFIAIFEGLQRAGNGHVILDIPLSKVPEDSEEIYWDHVVVNCCAEGVSFSERVTAEQGQLGPLAQIFKSLIGETVAEPTLVKPGTLEKHDPVSDTYLCDAFMYYIVNALTAEDSEEQNNDDQFPDVLSTTENALQVLQVLAQKMVTELSQKQVQPLYLFEIFTELRAEKSQSAYFKNKQIGKAFIASLAKISCELYPLLVGANKMNSGSLSIENISFDDFGAGYSLLRHCANSLEQILPTEIAQELIKKALEDVRNKKDMTNTLADESLDLAKYALQFGLQTEASECLWLSAQNTLGYGWRKDITLHEVFEAIEACSKANIGDVTDWLERIAPFVNDIFDFSERENRHIPGWYIRLLAKHAPARLVDEFAYHIANQNWLVAPEILKSFIENFELNTPAEYALLKCMTSYESMEALKKRADGNVELGEIYNAQIEFLGGLPPDSRDHGESSSLSDKAIDLNFEDFPPDDLGDLDVKLAEKAIITADDFLKDWISYWETDGQGIQVLEAFESIWNKKSGVPYRMSGCLDAVFELSLKLHGKTKSKKWAVRSIQKNSHWSRYRGLESEDALVTYAGIYSDCWEEFLIETTRSNKVDPLSKGWIRVPRDTLVKYLIAAKQYDLASEITEVMLGGVEREIEHLPISSLHWDDIPTADDQIAKKLLLLYYQWPDRYGRLRTANQIASLLDVDASFKAIFLDHLSQLTYEIEVSDLLSVLLLTKSSTFDCGELTAAIKLPSILSDRLLRLLGYEESAIPKADYHSAITVKSDYHSERFERAKDGIAPIYLNEISRLGERLKYPLCQHMAVEWDLISERKEFLYFNPYNFCGDQFYAQDKISCSLSTYGETVHLSAFLRTLSFASEQLGLEYDDALGMSTLASPFGGVCSAVEPSKEPSWWPVLEAFDENSELPTDDYLAECLEKISINEKCVLYANGPVSRGQKGLCCDLEVMRVYLGNEASLNATAMYDFLKQNEGGGEGITPYFQNRFIPKMGRWEIDLFLRGFSAPSFTASPFGNGADIRSDSIGYISADSEIAQWRYWSHHWYPAQYRGLGTNLGTYLTSSEELMSISSKTDEGGDYLIGKLTIIDKRSYKSDVKPIEIFSIKQIT